MTSKPNKTYTYERLDGGFTNVVIGNKKIMKSYQNALDKAKTTPWWEDYSEGFYYVSNYYSGQSFVLDALQYSIHSWVLGWEKRYEKGLKTIVPVSTFDNMRYLFLALDTQTYMGLLD